MYPEQKPTPWWLEAFVLTRAVFGILFWPLVAVIGVLVAIVGLIFAFAAHWGFGVLALALIGATVGGFVWWESRRCRPPE